MTDWTQKRTPDSVPTPIAVAVSGFCRRAKMQAVPAQVREALSFLSDQDDFRVRPVTDAKPEAAPLGPFAVVDIVLGASAELAARRQSCGYYDLVRQLAHRPPAEPAAKPPAEAQAKPAPRPAKAAKKSPAGDSPTLAERIGPKKRPPAEPGEELGPALAEEPLVSKRQLPAPRGRFTRLASAKHSVDELLEPGAREVLSTLIDQHGNRAALLQALAEQYAGRAGSPLGASDLEAVLEHHRLSSRLASRERETVLSAYREHRGASGRVAWALGMSPAELDRLVKGSGLSREVEELRERFKREALSPDLRYRLDLLGRHRYLSDLGIKDRFTQRLTADLKALLEGCLEKATDLPSLVQAAAKKHGLPPELLSRAVDKLGLAAALSQRLPHGAAAR